MRHDKALHTVKLQPHLADVPNYLIPKSLKRVASISKSREHKRRKQSIFCGEHKYNKVSKVSYCVLVSKYENAFITPHAEIVSVKNNINQFCLEATSGLSKYFTTKYMFYWAS